MNRSWNWRWGEAVLRLSINDWKKRAVQNNNWGTFEPFVDNDTIDKKKTHARAQVGHRKRRTSENKEKKSERRRRMKRERQIDVKGCVWIKCEETKWKVEGGHRPVGRGQGRLTRLWKLTWASRVQTLPAESCQLGPCTASGTTNSWRKYKSEGMLDVAFVVWERRSEGKMNWHKRNRREPVVMLTFLSVIQLLQEYSFAIAPCKTEGTEEDV